MAEKQVSVRLVARGGRQVTATLKGVGEAGRRSFRRLSDEVERASRRLAGYSGAVRRAGRIAAAAFAGTAALAIRSSLATVDAQAKLAQSLGTTTESVQVLARAAELSGVSFAAAEAGAGRLTRRLSLAAQNAGPAAGVFRRLNLSVAELQSLTLDERIVRINAAIEEFVPLAERAAVRSKIFGEEGFKQFSRITTETIRQATEDVRAFGVMVSEQDAAQIQRTNDALSRLGLIWRGLANQLAVAAAPALEAAADALAAISRVGGPVNTAIEAVLGNLGRLAAIATSFAVFMAGRWAAGLAAAALSVRGLATALVVLRGALIRTGIGALIVAAGELIYRFGRLVRAAGGFGEAMRLLKAVALEVWERIGLGGRALGAALQSVWTRIQAGWLSALKVIQERWAGFLRSVAGGLENVPGFEESFRKLGNAAIRAQSGVYALELAIDETRGRAEALGRSAREMAAAAIAPLESIQALRDAVAAGSAEAETALEDAAEAAGQVQDALTKAGSAGRAAGEQVATGWAAVREALDGYAEAARATGKDIGEALTGAFQGAEAAVARFVKSGKLEIADLVSTILADLAKIAARRFVFAPVAQALSGALGGLSGAVLHAGGVAGAAGPRRRVPAAVFAGAPRYHGGGIAGLGPNEVPAILERGERVLSRRETRAYAAGQQAPVVVNIQARDAESFRQSRAQVASDIARAVALGRRGL